MHITPLQFLGQYRSLWVAVGVEESASLRMCVPLVHHVQLRTYFMMSWKEGAHQLANYQRVTGAPTRGKTAAERDAARDAREWFAQHARRIQSAAMGKGAPLDYELALEWAVRAGKLANPTDASLQKFCDDHLGIDCSGFVTNYLAAIGKRSYSANLVRNTSAMSYYDVAKAVNDPSDVRQGDLLVWMQGRRPKTNPGHVAVVESYLPMSRAAGNLHVVEATGHRNAWPRLLDSWYAVEQIVEVGNRELKNDVMILQVRRHQTSSDRVAVIRPL